jgi:phosphonate transport system substrate-binding protein
MEVIGQPHTCLKLTRRKPASHRRVLRFVTFLAPSLYSFYAFVTNHLGEQLHCKTDLAVGTTYDQLSTDCDVAFVCGLPYVESTRCPQPPVEPLAAPVLQGARYRGRPIYFSDVIVRRDSAFRSFADLRGCTWVYNEPHSQSGYGITRYRLVRHGTAGRYFNKVVKAGFHERAIHMVRSGAGDASAIDSHVLSVALRDRPELWHDIRVIDALGPSTIQPVVAARRLPKRLKEKLRESLLEIAQSRQARPYLDHAFVQRFVPVSDSSYDDIRRMLGVVERAGFSSIC